MEPILIPSVEKQVIGTVSLPSMLVSSSDGIGPAGRIHRIGQEHATFVHKFYITDSVEEAVMSLAETKAELVRQEAKGALPKGKGSDRGSKEGHELTRHDVATMLNLSLEYRNRINAAIEPNDDGSEGSQEGIAV